MTTAKSLYVAPIAAHDAHVFVRAHHYSRKSVNNSQLHLGVFFGGVLSGVLQFGPSLDKRKLIGLVRDTPWNGFIELNRMAMVEDTPRNTESRAIAVAMRLIRKTYPHIQWIVSFADATQSGDGTIYRASGFVLTQIKKNNQIWGYPGMNPDKGNLPFSRMSPTDGSSKNEQWRATCFSRVSVTKASNILETGAASMKSFKEAGLSPLPGFQLRYIYFLDPTARDRLTCPILPFSEIVRRQAGMYKGRPSAGSIVADASAIHAEEGGSIPTPVLHLEREHAEPTAYPQS